MLISVFKDGTYVTDIDYSYTPPVEHQPEVKDEDSGEIISEEILGIPAKGNPECIGCFDVEFDPNSQDIEVSQKKGKFVFNIINK